MHLTGNPNEIDVTRLTLSWQPPRLPQPVSNSNVHLCMHNELQVNLL